KLKFVVEEVELSDLRSCSAGIVSEFERSCEKDIRGLNGMLLPMPGFQNRDQFAIFQA
ncbi:hypothetical protein Tco_1425462, partial [Tanacetum coccineum]